MFNEQLALKPNEIRSVLRNWVTDKFQLKHDDILIDELGFSNKDPNSTVDSSFRADLALANGRLVGFEIKSEKDSLKRWTAQMQAYSNVFDEVWLCTHNKHLLNAIKITPQHIGIMVIDDFKSIAVVRGSSKHPLNNVYDLTGLLWREEINQLLKNHNLKISTRATKNEVRLFISQSLTLNEVRPFVLQQLKYRKS
jgi:hypothetical protein